jgi:hypothetical protein
VQHEMNHKACSVTHATLAVAVAHGVSLELSDA